LLNADGPQFVPESSPISGPESLQGSNSRKDAQTGRGGGGLGAAAGVVVYSVVRADKVDETIFFYRQFRELLNLAVCLHEMRGKPRLGAGRLPDHPC
jgi:hypothetical protein